MNDGQAHMGNHPGGAQLGLAFRGQGRHDAGCRQRRVPLEYGHEIRIAQHPPTAGMGNNGRLITGNAAGQQQSAQVIALLLEANAGDNFAQQPTNGRLVSAPRTARFVYDVNQSALPAAAASISSSTAACKTARK